MNPITFDSAKFHYMVDESIYKQSKTHFKQLEPNIYEAVDPDTFAERLKSAHASGDLDSSSFCPLANFPDEGILAVTTFIAEETTEAEFDAFISSRPNFRYESGNFCRMNALCAAALTGNDKLVTHILKSGGTHLVNLAAEGRKTALMWAACCKNLLQGFKAAEVLLDHKANVIAMCTGENGVTFLGWTALNYALESKNLPLVQKLLVNGAITRKKMNRRHKGAFEEAVTILFTRYLAIRNRVLKDLAPSIIEKSI